MIKAVIFDCFGVLVEDGWLAFLHQYAGGLNDEQLHYLNKLYDLGQLSLKDFLAQVSHLTDVPPEEVKRIITAPHHVNEKLIDLITNLKPHYKIGMISNAGVDLSSLFPTTTWELFDDTTLSFQVGALKPQPEIYQHSLERLKVKSEEAVFIDDRQYNCDGAEAVGMKVVLYEDFKQTAGELVKLGVRMDR